MRYFLAALLAFLCFSLCAQEENLQALALPAALTRNAHIVVRNESTAIHVLSRREMKVRKRRVVTVLDKAGNDLVDAYLFYNNSIEVEAVEARVFNMLGAETDRIREKDFKDVSAVSGETLYSDSRIKYLEYTPVQYPYTVAFEYEISTENTGLLPAWYLLRNYGESVEQTEYEVHFSEPELAPEFREFNLKGLELRQERQTDRIRYEASGIPAITGEALSPPFSELVPHVKSRMVNFHYEGVDAHAADWQTLGTWITDNLLEGQGGLPETTKSRVRALVEPLQSPIEKARAIYEYVQKNTRYISVQVGIGGIKPIDAMEVDRVKYGDCKGLSNYTRSLLAAAGIPSYYCHVEAGREKSNFLDDFADLSQGNHVILAIPEGDRLHWIDCTSTTLPFGFLGDFTDDRKVLMVTPDGGKLVQTPSYLNESNYKETLAELEVTPTGDVSGAVTLNTKGIQYDQRFGLASQPRDKQIESYRKYWTYVNNLNIGDIALKNDKETIAFTENLQMEAAAYAGISGDLMLLAPNVLDRSMDIPDRYRTRTLPFDVPRGFLDEDRFVLKLPASYRLESMKPETFITSEYGEYLVKMEYDPEKHVLNYERRLLVRAGRYSSEKYESYRDFRRAVAAADSGQIILKRNSL